MRVFFALLLALVSSVAPAQTVPDKSPEELIRFIYAQYVGKKADDPAPFEWTSKRMADRLFEPALARAVAKASGDTIGFDPFIDAQDFEIKSYTLKSDEKKGDRIRITAEFVNMDTPTRVTYELVETKAGWRIRDISWREASRPSFRRMLKVR